MEEDPEIQPPPAGRDDAPEPDRLKEIEKRLFEMERNLAVQQALLDERLLRVETNRLFRIWNSFVSRAGGMVSRTRRWAARSPLRSLAPDRALLQRNALQAAYETWMARESAALPVPEQARAVSDSWTLRPSFSILLAIRDGRRLLPTLDSIQNQVYRDWEIRLLFDPRSEDLVLPALRTLEGGPIRHMPAPDFEVAAALNAAAGIATGGYLLFMDEGDTLSPFALHYVAEALQFAAYDLVYSDEDSLDGDGRRSNPRFKPGWSPDLLTSCMYMGHLLTVRRDVFEREGGLRSEYAGACLHDLVLRIADRHAHIHRIPRVLYHARAPAAAAPDEGGQPSADRASGRAIEDAIRRREGDPADCVPGPAPSTFVARRKRPPGEMTAIICSRSAELAGRCLESLRATAAKAVSRVIVVAHEDAGPNPALRSVVQGAGARLVPFAGRFNFAAMNNQAAALAETRHLLFLNDDVEGSIPGWAEMLEQQVRRDEVGVAGAVMRYPSGLIQHAGIVVGIGDGIGHVGRFVDSSGLWPWLLATRNVSAVTGACLAVRKEVFQQLGGFDPAFPNNYNDADLCFRARGHGLAVVCVPVPGLIHRECQTRRGIVRFAERYRFYKRWGDLLAQPDPYYSPSLAPTERIALNLDDDPWQRPLLSVTDVGGA